CTIAWLCAESPDRAKVDVSSAPVLGSGAGNTLDSLHKPLCGLRFSMNTPIHMFG
ncbi:hypothetical protein KUCAC02_024429, partial [Chaenocephalus aceratus]